MQKKLEVRTQKLSKKLPQEAREFSTTIFVEPEDLKMLEKKGSLYCVFDVTSEDSVDPLLVTKIVRDVLYDSYYSSESASPIQALERAIISVKEKVIALPGERSKEVKISDFNILAAVLWGNVVYMVQFGKGGSFLVRENTVKPVNTATEGNFSVASGVVKVDDVIVLGTQPFIDIYSAQDLILGKVSFSMSDLKATAAALLLKFEMSAQFTEEEKINFGLDEDKPSVAESKKSVKKVKTKLPKISVKRVKRKKIKPAYYVIGIVALTLIGSVILTVKGGFSFENVFKKDKQAEKQEETTVVESEEEKADTQDKEDTKKSDKELKIERINPEVFYDIKLVDENASPTNIAVLDSEVMVSDASTGKLFVSSLTTSKFTEESIFSGIKNLSNFGGDLTFVDNTGYKVYSKSTGTQGKVGESYEGTDLTPAIPYLAFLYSIKGDTLTKYQLLDAGLDGTIWAQSPDLKDAVDIAIDGSVYVLKKDSLIKFLSGEKQTFEISGLDTPLSNAVRVIKTVDLENIYIADKGNNRILVLDEEGVLQKQYLADGDKFSDIKDISISQDEKTLMILSESKVFSITLP
jgi:hypothetical protein